MIIALCVCLCAAFPTVADERDAVTNYSRPPAGKDHSYPDCYCTDSGGNRVELGRHACLKIGLRRVWALCDMSVNNPIWRYQDGPCPSV